MLKAVSLISAVIKDCRANDPSARPAARPSHDLIQTKWRMMSLVRLKFILPPPPIMASWTHQHGLIGWSSKARLALIRWPSRPHPRTGRFDNHLPAHRTDPSSLTFFCAADPPDKQLSKAAAVLQLTTMTWAAPLGGGGIYDVCRGEWK